MNWKLALRILVSLSLLVGLFFYLDIGSLISNIKSINIWLMLGAFFYLIVMVGFSVLGLKLLLDLKIKLPFFKLFIYNLYSWAISQFFLGKVGSFSLHYFIKKYNLNWKESMTFIFINQLFSLIVLLPFAIFGLYYFSYNYILYFIFIGIIFILLFLIFKELGFFKSFYGFIYSKLHSFIEVFSLIKSSPRIIFFNLILSFIGFVFAASVQYYYLSYFGFSISLIKIMVVSAIISILGAIPISLSGLGVHEAGAVYLFSRFGVDGAVVFTIFLIFRVVKYIFAGLILLHLSVFYKK